MSAPVQDIGDNCRIRVSEEYVEIERRVTRETGSRWECKAVLTQDQIKAIAQVIQ